MTANINIKNSRKCAFCKYWYDPANSNIMPQSPQMGVWKIIDTNEKSRCLKSNLQVSAYGSCLKYECKL